MLITDHAYARAKERCGLNKGAFSRILEKAIAANITHSNTKNHLNKYIYKCVAGKKYKFSTLLYDKYLILHTNEVVITVYHIPQSLLPITKFLKD